MVTAEQPEGNEFDPEDDEADEDRLDIIIFYLSGIPYACDLLDIQEIVQPLELKPVPQTTESFLGVFNLRGHIIGALDIRPNTDHHPRPPAAAFAITETSAGKVALLVDKIAKVISIHRDTVEPSSSVCQTFTKEYVRGFINDDEAIITYVNLKDALAHTDIDQYAGLLQEAG